MHDRIIRGTAASGMIRALAIDAHETVQTAQASHESGALATAAMGRLMMAAQMIGSLFKNPGERITLMVAGNGPLGALTAVADTEGHVKGYAAQLDAVASGEGSGQPDIAAGIGAGTLTIIRNSPHAEPYVSQIALVNGTICDDLTAYYIVSEQIPTVVGLDVILDEDGRVQSAGGYLVQLMPGYADDLLSQLEQALSAAPSLRAMLKQGLDPEGMLEQLLAGLEFASYETTPAAFHCDCSWERSEQTLLSLGAHELKELVETGEPVEIRCDFCSKRYLFDAERLSALASEL